MSHKWGRNVNVFVCICACCVWVRTLWNLQLLLLPLWLPYLKWPPRQRPCDPGTSQSSPLCLPGATWACHLQQEPQEMSYYRISTGTKKYRKSQTSNNTSRHPREAQRNTYRTKMCIYTTVLFLHTALSHFCYKGPCTCTVSSTDQIRHGQHTHIMPLSHMIDHNISIISCPISMSKQRQG